MTATNSAEGSVESTAGEDVGQNREASSSPLDDLIAVLIEYHESDLDAIQDNFLGQLPLRCRARSSLAKLQSDENPDEASLKAALETAVRHVFLAYPPVEAISWISELSPAVELANARASESRFDCYSTNIRMVAEYLVESYDIPTPESDNTLYDPRIAIRQIQGFRAGELLVSALEPYKAQGQVISAWGLVEQTLKLVLGFYTFHFSRPDWVRYLEDAVKKKSIGQIVQSLGVVEKIFRDGETTKERNNRKNELDKSLKPIQEGLAEVREELKHKRSLLEQMQANGKMEEKETRLKEEMEHLQKYAESLEKREKQKRDIWQQEEQEIRRDAEQRSRALRAECLACFDRESPFAGLDLKRDFPQELGSLYRNDFAHKPGDQIVEKKVVSESLRKAEHIITELVKKRAVPMFIRLVGQGTDAYRRRIFLFVEERWMTSRGKFAPDKLRWFYPASELEYEPFQRLLMIEPDADETLKDKTWKELIIEPVTYTPEEIASVIY